MTDALARLVVRFPLLILVITALVTAFAVTRIVDFSAGKPRIALDSSLNSVLSREDPDRIFYEHVRDLFGGEDTLVFAIEADRAGGVYEPAFLDRLVRATERLETHEAVERVTSLANAADVRDDAGSIRVTPFLDDIPTDRHDLEALRVRVDQSPVWAGNLVSRDGSTAALTVRLLPITDREFLDRRIDAALLERVEGTEGPGTVLMTGGPHVRAETSRLLRADLARVIPLILVSMALVSAVSFRSVRVAVVPIATTLIALLWVLGLIAASGRNLNTITVALPPLVLIVGFAYVVHIMAAVRDSEGGPRERVADGIRETLLPVLLAGVTTVAGFLALTVSSLEAVQEFGVFCAAGVACTVLAVVTFTPACLVFMPPPTGTQWPQLQRFFQWLADFNGRRTRAILIAGAVVAVVATLGIFRIHVGTGMIASFPEDNATAIHFDRIAERLEGASMLSIVLRSDQGPDGFVEPANLAAVTRLAGWLETQPEVGSVTSLADIVASLNKAFHEDDPARLVVPGDRDLIAQLLLLGPREDIADFADSDYSATHLLVRTSTKGSDEVGDLVRRIEYRMANALPETISGRVTGSFVLMSRTIDQIAASQASSLALAFVSIFAVLSLLFMSVRVGLIALVPNVLPVLFYFGLLGWTGTTLNLTTGIVACLVLGIAVDDTLHFMVNFNAAARKLGSEVAGSRAAIAIVGQPISYTSLALCMGFGLVTTASLQSLVDFGTMAAATLAFAWLVDITITPALASRLRIVTLWDLLSIDLGDEPHRTIPLFHGLTATQARIACLMLRVREYDDAQTIMKFGETESDFFVVLEGQLIARYPTAHGPLDLRTLTRGDVVGEVAVFRHRRTADVVADGPVRLLQAAPTELAALQRRYPRIAAQVYRNLSGVLADRLTDVTERLARP